MRGPWMICVASLVFAGLSAGLVAAERDAGTPPEGLRREAGGPAKIDKVADIWAGFDCSGGKTGWKRAKAVTPNLVGPCNSGNGGLCEGSSYEYVPGTGWCRPR